MEGRTTFPRVSGGIVLDSFSVVSFFTGLLAVLPAGLLLLVEASGPRGRGEGAAVFVVWGLTVLVVVARFAQTGVAGDSEGGLFSSSAGPWSTTLLVSARLLVLHLIWMLPFFVWGFLSATAAAPAGVPGLGMVPVPRIPILLAVWWGLGLALSFAFVAVSVAAPGFADLFSPGLWRTLFRGRLGELFVAVAGTVGPPLAVFALVFPVLLSLAPFYPKAALTFTVPFALYGVGMVLTLEGKLCGAFSAAGLAEEADVAEAEVGATVAGPAAPAVLAQSASAAPPSAPPTPAVGDPKSLHTLWQTRVAAGDSEGALAAAREAIPAGLAKGEPTLAAEVFRRHLDRLHDLALDRSAFDPLAEQLLRDGDVAAAAWTFSQALDGDPADSKAFKGLLKVAEHYSEKAKQPLESVRVYRYLLERAPASPFAEHARDLLADVERRAAREQTPQQG